jgi:DNA-binding transcriptional MerR regulator
MAKYNIKDLEKLTGIKAHTIRIWEKRYDLIQPDRTETNFRLYNDEQLKRLLNISILNRAGLKISKIASLEQAEIARQVAEHLDTDTDTIFKIDSLIQPLMDLDEATFVNKMSAFISEFGMEETMIQIIYPFLAKVGSLWLTDTISPAQEHFISHIIRQKLIVAIDQCNDTHPEARTFLLYLPEHEMHELGLLFLYYVIRKRGHKVYYLGQFVPYNDVQKILKDHPEINYVIASFTAPMDDTELQDYLNQLSKDAKGKNVIVSGYQIENSSLKLPSNVKTFKKASGFIKHLEKAMLFN